MGIGAYFIQRAKELEHCGLPILDLGCGDGRFVRELEILFPGRVYGFDLVSAESKCRQNLAGTPSEKLLGSNIRFGTEQSGLPFEDDYFGLIISNQVIEHVDDLDFFFSHAARVLSPKGCLLAAFPPKTHIVEAHCRAPLVHWIPGGTGRRTYLNATHSLFNIPRRQSTENVGEFWDQWIKRKTHYRMPGHVRYVASKYFEQIDDDASAYARSIMGDVPGIRLLRWIPYYLLNTTLIMYRHRTFS